VTRSIRSPARPGCHWGVSNFSGQQIKDIMQQCDTHGWQRPVVSQPPLSWLRRDELDDRIPT